MLTPLSPPPETETFLHGFATFSVSVLIMSRLAPPCLCSLELPLVLSVEVVLFKAIATNFSIPSVPRFDLVSILPRRMWALRAFHGLRLLEPRGSHLIFLELSHRIIPILLCFQFLHVLLIWLISSEGLRSDAFEFLLRSLTVVPLFQSATPFQLLTCSPGATGQCSDDCMSVSMYVRSRAYV